MEHSVSVEDFQEFWAIRNLFSFYDLEKHRVVSNGHGKWHRSESCIMQAGGAKGKVNKGQRRRIVRVSKHEKARVIESALKIRSYLPGNTSAVRHASTLFFAVMVVSRTKGRPALHLYPANTAKAISWSFHSLLTKVFLRLVASRCLRIIGPTSSHHTMQRAPFWILSPWQILGNDWRNARVSKFRLLYGNSTIQ